MSGVGILIGALEGLKLAVVLWLAQLRCCDALTGVVVLFSGWVFVRCVADCFDEFVLLLFAGL